MRADDVRAFKRGCGSGGNGTIEPLVGSGIPAVASKRAPNERLARRSGKKREAKRVQLIEAGEKRIVLVKFFAEAEAGVEHDAVMGDAVIERVLRILAQLSLNFSNNIGGGRQVAPFLWAAARVH